MATTKHVKYVGGQLHEFSDAKDIHILILQLASQNKVCLSLTAVQMIFANNLFLWSDLYGIDGNTA